MAGGKLSPRQKMINMMYLVLTALLALNVSKEVLKTFFEVNIGIIKTTESLDEKSESTYASLRDFNDQTKAAPYIALTTQIEEQTDILNLYIQEQKYNLVFTADNKVYLGDYEKDDKNLVESLFTNEPDFNNLDNKEGIKIGYLKAKSNRDASTKVFGPWTGPGKQTGTVGNQLKQNINNYTSFLKNLLTAADSSGLPLDKNKLTSLLSEIQKWNQQTLEEDNKESWEHYSFHDMPAVAALTLLTKLQSDIKNIEAEVASFLANSVGQMDLKFTDAKATSIPSSNYITKGDQFNAEIFLSAFDKNQKPEIYVGKFDSTGNGKGDNGKDWKYLGNGDPLDIVDGKGIYTVKTGRTGPQSYQGFIKIPQENGNKFYSFEGEYTVAPPSSAVSPDYMLAMFVGQKNPITVSAAGQDLKNVNISISQGKKEKKKTGEWIVIPSKKGKLKVTVSGINSKGSRIKLGYTEFNVFDVPPPVIQIAGISNSKREVSAMDIANAQRLKANKKGFIEVFKGLSYSVKSFKLSISNMKKGKSTGPPNKIKRLDDATKYLKQAGSGDKVMITDIRYSVNGGKAISYDNDIVKIIK